MTYAKSPSVYSVAKAAGTSVGTVSNVINHPERVRPALRKRVENAMKELSYTPHPVARALSLGRSHLLAAVVFDIANPFFAEIAHLLDQQAQRSGSALTIAGTDQSVSAEKAALASMSRAGADGYAVCTTGGCFDILSEIRSRGTPVLLFAQRSEDDRVPAVTIDDRAGMALIADHLIGRGVERFAFLREPINAMQHRDRFAGFVATLETRGHDIDKVMIVEGTGPTWNAGIEAAQRILAQPRGTWPDCFVCLNDYTAMGVCRALKEAGVSVGKDILVTGYDDIPYAAMMDPPLTTIRQPLASMAQHLITQLMGAIERRTSEVEGRLFAPELVIRQSA